VALAKTLNWYTTIGAEGRDPVRVDDRHVPGEALLGYFTPQSVLARRQGDGLFPERPPAGTVIWLDDLVSGGRSDWSPR
jgi:hypothetical protein